MWDALRAQLPGDSGVFYSLRMRDGGSERGIDFVVAIPGCGLAVLEVKGGRVERHHDGRFWGILGTRGKALKLNPMEQASEV